MRTSIRSAAFGLILPLCGCYTVADDGLAVESQPVAAPAPAPVYTAPAPAPEPVAAEPAPAEPAVGEATEEYA